MVREMIHSIAPTEPIPDPEPYDEPWWNNSDGDAWADIIIPKNIYDGLKLPYLPPDQLEKN